MQVRLLSCRDEILQVSEDWARLAGSVPYRSPGWLSPWWEQFGPGHELFVLAVETAGSEPLGLAPWYVTPCHSLGRVVRFLGSGQACSDYLCILARPGCEQAVATAVAKCLLNGAAVAGKGSQANWDLLELSSIWPGDPTMSELVRQMSEGGCTAHRRPAASCWRIALPTTWEEYLATLSKPNRRRMRWAQKRLQAADCRRHVAETAEEFQRGWKTLVELHQQRRSSLGDPGCFACPRFEQFLYTAAEQFHGDGRVRLSWIEIDQAPVAAMICFVGNGVTYAYQTGIAADSLHENPGWLIQSAAIREAIDAGHHSFDLLRGDEPYKGHLGAEPRPTIELRIVPNRLVPQLRHTAWLAAKTIKATLGGVKIW